MPAEKLRIALDSSYVIALLSDWHANHQRTLRSYQHWRDRAAQIVLPVHAVLECYSVLTRIPPPHRLVPETAKQVIEENFGTEALIVGAEAEGIWQRLSNISSLGIRGGQVYDAQIAWSAADAGASILLTWNVRHFALIGVPNLDAREP